MGVAGSAADRTPPTTPPAAGAPAVEGDDGWGLSGLAEVVSPSSGRTLLLARSWPRSPDHLLLEYRDGTSTVAGQWFADPARLRTVAGQTAVTAPGRVAVVEDTGVMLQAGGADRRLVDLADVVGAPGSELVVHRPERRAVVRVTRGAVVTYRKLSRPGPTVRRPDGVAVGGVRVPDVVASDAAAGSLESAELPGRPLHALLGDVGTTDGQVEAAFCAAGAALRALHGAEPAPGLAHHDVGAEWHVARKWVDHAVAHEVLPAAAVSSARRALEDLRTRFDRLVDPATTAVVHRDLHDKQVLVDDGDRVGLLDLDTLALGDPALDLANLAVHLELRVLQGWCGPERAASAGSALLDGYRPTAAVVAGLDAYAAATRLRLACVYAFRPRWRGRAVRLLEPLGAV